MLLRPSPDTAAVSVANSTACSRPCFATGVPTWDGCLPSGCNASQICLRRLMACARARVGLSQSADKLPALLSPLIRLSELITLPTLRPRARGAGLPKWDKMSHFLRWPCPSAVGAVLLIIESAQEWTCWPCPSAVGAVLLLARYFTRTTSWPCPSAVGAVLRCPEVLPKTGGVAVPLSRGRWPT